ncbi:MAG: FadR family transcriptional regulator [Rhodobacteraceae bacterium]|nr:MAG: FadR family transcriptional regulator [Paracoccaceae bacterium]
MAKSSARGETRVERTRAALQARIASGEFPVGARLPSEAKLCEEYGLSRTVIREAIAALRFEGLVEPRQGAGVFVIEAVGKSDLPFADVDAGQVSSVVEMLELRCAVEVECAALAAQRHSPAQAERIAEAAVEVARLAREAAPTAEADLALHQAIAAATNNPRFGQFLELLGQQAIPRAVLKGASEEAAGYLRLIEAEHRQIVDAILDRDAGAARDAMRRHLEGSQKRYRAILRKGGA